MVNAFVADLRRMRRSWSGSLSQAAMIKAAGLALLVLLGVTYSSIQTYRWLRDQRALVSTDDAYVAADIVPVTPRVPGTVTRVLVSDDQAVHTGDLLAQLDDRDLQAQRQRAAAGVDAANAQIASARARKHLQSALQAEARADLSSAEADDEHERGRSTVRTKKASAVLERAQAAVDAANLQAQVLDAQENEAQASLTRAKAELASADLALSYCEIRSPIDGVVGSRVARVGAHATTGSALFSIVPTAGHWVEANFKETQVEDLKPGMSARIEADGLPGMTFKGVVRGIAPASGSEFSIVPTENATGNFTKIVQRVPVRIDLDGTGSRAAGLRPGMSVIVHVDTRSAPAAPAAPPRAQGAS